MIRSQLAEPYRDNVMDLIGSNQYAAQQKIDGQRLMIKLTDRIVRAFNRNAEPKNCPLHLSRAMQAIPGTWIFDGEYVSGRYWIFDVLEMPRGDLTTLPWIERQDFLSRVVGAFPENKHFGVVPRYNSSDEKQAFYNVALDHHFEGVMFKDVNRPYFSGRTKDWYKVKFVNDIDCVIIGEAYEGRRNFILGLYDKGEIIEVGRVSALTGESGRVKIGDVVSVSVLNVSDSNKLIQPVSPRMRTDKAPEDCCIDQLEACRKNKEVIAT